MTRSAQFETVCHHPRRDARRLPFAAWAALLAAALLLGLAALQPGRASAQELDSDGIEVFALQGTLRQAVGQPFDTFLVDASGRTFGLFGRTPEVAQQITQLRRQVPSTPVKIWGTLFPNGRLSSGPEIVVSSILGDQPPPPPPTPTPVITTPRGTVTGPVVNVRSGPGTAYPVLGQVTQGAICDLVGRNSNSSWFQSRCPAIAGWISAGLLAIQGNISNLPVVAVAPPPPQETFPDWRGSYFANRDLARSPTFVRNDTQISFDWGGGSPGSGLPADNFSVRWERQINFSPGIHRFTLRVDDGARLWVGNTLLLDDWRESSVRTLTADLPLSGVQTVRVEYFEAFNQAVAQLTIEQVGGAPVAPPPGAGATPLQPNSTDWAASYYSNIDLSGNPAVVRFEPRTPNPLDRNWGLGSPAPGQVPDDNWSARFVGVWPFAAGDHTFRAISDDGIRVFINDIPIINEWRDGHKEVQNTFRQLGPGNHTITIEFYERGGAAYATVLWFRETNTTNTNGAARNE